MFQPGPYYSELHVYVDDLGLRDLTATVRGESIVVEPSTTDVGDGVAGESKRFSIRLTNDGDRPIRIVGGTTTCSCMATESLPLTLGVGTTCSLDVQIKFLGPPGRFRHRFSLITDEQRHPEVVAHFSGRVIASAEVSTTQTNAVGSW